MSDTKQFELSGLKDFGILIPVFGTAIAITYDLGFFWGLDINFFTLFSLTEHIVFAIEALPLALGLSFVLAILFVVYKTLEEKHMEKFARETAALSIQQKLELIRKNNARFRLFSVPFSILSLAWIIYAWPNNSLLVFIVLIACANLHTTGASFFPKILYSPSYAASYAATVSLLMTFAVGVDVQQRYVREGKAVHVIALESSELTGRIVRAGERGLLFYDPGSREISFVRWDTVKRVRTVPPT